MGYIWIVSHLSAKNYQNWCKFDEVLTKTNLLSFFWDTVYVGFNIPVETLQVISEMCLSRQLTALVLTTKQ